MAALVTGLARLFQPTMMLPGGNSDGLGLAPWYLLLGLRLVALLLANDPWSSAKADLVCNWTKTTMEEHLQPFCQALCFNQHFSSPISSVWGLGFLLGLFPVGFMGLISVVSKHQKKATRAAEEKQANPDDVNYAMAATELHPSLKEATSERNVAASDAKISTLSTWHLAASAFLVIFVLVMELIFLWVVIALQIPLVSETTFRCLLERQACPPVLECVMLGQVDKKVALWGLIFTAIVNVVVCLSCLLLRLVKIFRCHR
ncbi:gap junction beta-2 protein-like [Pseudonaja textilis]|uniref:gap junction beta-2 protein-like n=1 Tax=Pseudonaja textilis TaxID=8673 RepID=UPI000EAAC2B0|nr:gap junction beta-2 protein-like [Pseudonaja textilis]